MALRTEALRLLHVFVDADGCPVKEEVYRVCYLLSQAGSPGSDVRVSGLSKQRDFNVTQEVLRGYGDLVKDTMKQVLRDGCLDGDVAIDAREVNDLAPPLRHQPRVIELVRLPLGEAHRESLYRLTHKLAHHRRDRRRVDAAGKEHPERDVRHQAQLDGFAEAVAELADESLIGNAAGVGTTNGNVDDDLDEINSVSVRDAPTFQLLACADVHPGP